MPPALFAALDVRDRAAAIAWYTRLLGAEPAFLPNDVEAVFEIAEDRYVYVEEGTAHVGHSRVTLFLDDLDAFLTEARSRGLEPTTTETYDNGVRKAIFRDPDGNEFGVGGGPA
ncbi:VOC family protein [Actinomycetospora sp. OC33-EN08]|uniref:VOC family protein n=1 Tax=Actinomycetospora aurantiaca TaxID=3129233 RepID=A0ABU8MHM5_9PSEU